MAADGFAMTSYGHQPSALLLTDGDAAAARVRQMAERANLRICGSDRIADAIGRIERQAAMDAVLVEIEHDPGPMLDRLLERLAADTAASRYGAVIVAPPALIDAIAARGEGRIEHLCDPSEEERALATAAAAGRTQARLHDVVKSGVSPNLQQLSAEVGRIASMLAELSEQGEDAALARAAVEEGGAAIDPEALRHFIRVRRMRERFFHPALFADPAWDMLLDLMASRLEGTKVAVSSLCIAAAVPPTTALRWIKTLTDHGLFVRQADPADGRRVFIELSDDAARAMEGWYRATMKLLQQVDAKD
ncbi:winged helix DNA-binding protein [Allosphingosinicella indica]|uniref:Winged helix DNA-binding domain-containing protein n=1 Tax=Allosphingosinicella indica TaxID=941907 RepID=A0A1X7FZE2_9SPHN|nr:winged helix DNA-binding protein [Allosphingosinicella indica]SMF61494.1 Winged helix DNA-binding domain-containing protein [Allosphingosinicella indica]